MRIASEDRNSPKIRSVGGIINWMESVFELEMEISYIYIYKRFCRLRKIREIWDCPEKESGYGESNNIVYKYPFVSSFIPKLTFERRDKCVNHEKFYYASSLSSSGRNLHGGNSARHQLHPPKCTLPSCLTEWRHTGGAITELRPL